MKRTTQLTIRLGIVCLILSLVLSCEKEKDKYYERPASLAPPIYQQLDTAGNFINFLKCVDKSGFKDVLSRTGYITVFAPNDEAFSSYLTANNSTIDDIDSAKAREIVSYSMLYNAYKISDFDRYQSGSHSTEDDSIAFKRKTYYYRGFYYENLIVDNRTFLAAVLDPPGNNFGYINDYNNKYIPIFTDAFFNFNRLTAEDYNYFFPNTVYNGMNVADARVIDGDHDAENGYYHEIDKVLEPLPNLDACLLSNSKYSKFRQILDTLSSYVFIDELLERYNNLQYKPYPNAEGAYYKVYNVLFNPNNENYFMVGADGQANCYTLAAPTNEALDQIMEERIAFYYPDKNYKNLPIDILANFVNAHMFSNAIWPSNPTVGLNYFQEQPSFEFPGNIEDSKFCSNGIFYGINQAQFSNIFMTVYGDIYLNRNMSMFLYGVARKEMVENLRIPVKNYTLFLLNDAFLKNYGFDLNFDRSGDPLFYLGKGTSVSPAWNPADSLTDIVSVHVANKIADISGKGSIETYYGDAIGYENGYVYGAGNLDIGQKIKCSPVEGTNPVNGNVYYCDSTILLSKKPAGYHIEKYFKETRFWDYFHVNKIYDSLTYTITDLKSGIYYTMLIPDDDAIQSAIDNGDLPADSAMEADKIMRFIQLHIIKGKSICADGSAAGNGGFLTLLTGGAGSARVVIVNTPGSLAITDQKGRTVIWDADKSNVLSNKMIIHTIKGYLKF